MQRLRRFGRAVSTGPATLQEWSARVLTVAVALLLAASFFLLQQVQQLDSVIQEGVVVVLEDDRANRDGYRMRQLERDCVILRALAVEPSETRRLGCR